MSSKFIPNVSYLYTVNYLNDRDEKREWGTNQQESVPFMYKPSHFTQNPSYICKSF